MIKRQDRVTKLALKEEGLKKHFIDNSFIQVVQQIAASLHENPKAGLVIIQAGDYSYLKDIKNKYNSLTKEQKIVTIFESWELLAEILLFHGRQAQCTNIANFLAEHFAKHHDFTNDLPSLFGFTALARAAILNPEVADFTFKLIVDELPINSLRDLHFILRINATSIKDLTDPTNEQANEQDSDLKISHLISYAIMIYLTTPNSRAKYLDYIETSSKLSSEDIVSLYDSEDNILKELFRQKLLMETQDLHPFLPATTMDIEKQLKKCDNLVDIYASLLQTGNNSKEIENLVTTYSFEDVIFTINYMLTKDLQQSSIDCMHEAMLNDLNNFTTEELRWFNINLMLPEQTDSVEEFLEEPSPTTKEKCEKLLFLAKKSTLLWRLMYNKTFELLDSNLKDLVYVLIYFYLNLEQLSLDNKLWLWMAAETGEILPVFKLSLHTNHNGINQANLNQSIYGNLVTLYIESCKYTPELRKTLQNILLFDKKSNKIIATDKSAALDSYLRTYVEEKLMACDNNSLHWLYLALSINSRVNRAEKPIFITKPQGFQLQIVNNIIKKCYYNKNFIPLFLDKITSKINPENLNKLENLCSIYHNNLLKNLDTNSNAWLYKNLKQTIIPFEDNQFAKLPYEMQLKVAKIIYIIAYNQNMHKYSTVTQYNPQNFLNFMTNNLEHMAPLYLMLDNEYAANFYFDLLIQNLSNKAKEWVGESILSGKYNSMEFMAKISKSEEIVIAKDLQFTPGLMILTIKYDNFKIKLLEEINYSIPDTMPMVTCLELDYCMLGNHGLLALKNALDGKRKYLSNISLTNTGIDERSLIPFSNQVMIGLSDNIKKIYFHNNAISNTSISNYINFLRDNNKKYLQWKFLEAIIHFIKNPLVIGYIGAILEHGDIFCDIASYRRQFYRPMRLSQEFEKADIVLDAITKEPQMGVIKLLFADQYSRYISYTTYQLVAAAITSTNCDFIFNVLKEISLELINQGYINIIEHLNNCITNRHFYIPQYNTPLCDKLYRNDNGYIDMYAIYCSISMACLIQALPQGFVPKSYTSINLNNKFSSIDVNNIQLEPIMMVAIINSFGKSECNFFAFSNCLLDNECLNIINKNFAPCGSVALDLSNNLFAKEHSQQISRLLQSNFCITSINVSDCFTEEESLLVFLRGLSQTGLEQLILRNQNHCNNDNITMRSEAVKALGQEMLKPECTLTKLDISYNKISSTYLAKYILPLVEKNILTQLIIDDNELSDNFMDKLIKLLEHNTSSQHISCSNNSANFKTLEQVIVILRYNNILNSCNLKPKLVANDDGLATRYKILAIKIASMIVDKIKYSDVVDKMMSLSLSYDIKKSNNKINCNNIGYHHKRSNTT